MTLEALARIINAPLITTYHPTGRWTIGLEGTVVRIRGNRIAAHGRGPTLPEARKDYVDQIVGEQITYGHTTVRVPDRLNSGLGGL